MNKTIKKRENNLINALTAVCETAKCWRVGFEWLTHTTRYDNFPGSLMITCVFSSDSAMASAIECEADKKLRRLIQAELLKIGIRVKDIRRHVRMDSEESCERQDQGDWQKRLDRWRG
ncbi:Fis family transcriptional regulator [Alteromonas ponticola]|uniref:Fis family transcriptional regulator n=1 Tax=Alteromonas ponticola TaxID=2720613 RepID=A0ABX1R3C8_9ALTE|nr:Fis family transcriptional regulator [Alteromonas ponticola]NMH60947.1 Fis family transcriptional regulator [Alteromonas ponticola]